MEMLSIGYHTNPINKTFARACDRTSYYPKSMVSGPQPQEIVLLYKEYRGPGYAQIGDFGYLAT